jgi:hypothetical protein
VTEESTEPDESSTDPHDRLRVGGWVPSRNDSTATQMVPLVPVASGVEVPDFLQPREIGPLWPERVERRRGRWWFLAVPVVLALLMVAVVLQFGSDDDPVRQAAPELAPAVAGPSPSASSAEPSASASPSATPSASSSSAPRRSASPSASAKPSSTSPAPRAHRGAVVGIGGRCLAVDRDRAEIAVCDDRGSQRWSAPGDGTVRALNRCLDVFASGEANGTPVILYPCNRSDAQQWQRRGDGTWRNPQSNKCLSTVGGRSDPGTRLAVFDCTGAPHQRWTLT